MNFRILPALILPLAVAVSWPLVAAHADDAQVLPGEAGNLVDKNGDGIITADEMDAFAVAVFPALDTNGDGVITVEELTEQVRADFKTADQNGDGVLN